MMNNPMQLLIAAAKNGGNTSQVIQQMARSNPQMAQAARMISGKSPAQLQQMAMNMCKERGTTPEAIMRELGLM